MTPSGFQTRRATLDDLPALRPLWEAERLDPVALEKRLTEFQVACDAEGRVVGAIGLQLVRTQALIHSEVFADFALADTLRPLLWERIRTLGRNHSLARAWSRESARFWRGLGFDPATEEQLARLPAGFGVADGHWLTLKLRDDPFAEMSPEEEDKAFKQPLRADTDKMLRQAKFLRGVAVALAVAFIIVMAIAGWYLLRYRSAHVQPTPERDPYAPIWRK